MLDRLISTLFLPKGFLLTKKVKLYLASSGSTNVQSTKLPPLWFSLISPSFLSTRTLLSPVPTNSRFVGRGGLTSVSFLNEKKYKKHLCVLCLSLWWENTILTEFKSYGWWVALHLNKLPCFTIKEKGVYHPGKQHLGIYYQYPLVTDQGLTPFIPQFQVFCLYLLPWIFWSWRDVFQP